MTGADIAAAAHAGIAAGMRARAPFIAMSSGSDSVMSGIADAITARMSAGVPFIAMSCGSNFGMSGIADAITMSCGSDSVMSVASRSRMGFPIFGELIAVANRMPFLKA